MFDNVLITCDVAKCAEGMELLSCITKYKNIKVLEFFFKLCVMFLFWGIFLDFENIIWSLIWLIKSCWLILLNFSYDYSIDKLIDIIFLVGKEDAFSTKINFEWYYYLFLTCNNIIVSLIVIIFDKLIILFYKKYSIHCVWYISMIFTSGRLFLRLYYLNFI